MRTILSVLAVSVLTLALFGIVILTSVSNVQGEAIFDDPLHFAVQQFVFLFVALICAVTVSKIPVDFWWKPWVMRGLILLVVFALISVHIGGLGIERKGSARWIDLAGVTVQPSEFVKLAAILVVSFWVGRNRYPNDLFGAGIIAPGIFLCVVMIGFLSQPDYGSVFMLAVVNGCLLFIAGAKPSHLGLALLLFSLVIGVMILNDPERVSRIVSIPYFSSAEESGDDGYQVWQSIAAFSSGGPLGKGLGNSLYKRRYLPENHTDFVFPMVAEELGIPATMTCVVLYLAIWVCGFLVSLKCNDLRMRLVSLGMTLHLCLSAFVNLGVVTGVLPTKGLAMPFLSYGGSNLVSSFIAVGFIFAAGFSVLRSEGAETTVRFDGQDGGFWND